MVNDIKIREQKITRVCEKINKFLVYLIVFLVPLFFSPLTLDPLDFNKQFLVGILVSIALIFLTVKAFVSGKFEISINQFNIPILVFFLTSILSTIFSSWRYASFWGWPLDVNQGLLTLFYFFSVYFLINASFREEKEISSLLIVFIGSVFLASLFAILQLFNKFILPWSFSKISSFNTIGALNSLSLLLAVLMPLALVLTTISKKLARWLLLIFIFSSLIFLALINSRLAWLILAVGVSIIFIFGLSRFKKTGESVLVFSSIVLIIISLFFLIFRLGIAQDIIPLELVLSQNSEFKIIKKSLSDAHNFFLGTGPSTFSLNYSRFKPLEINQTDFWGLKFHSGSSEIFDKLLTSGTLGFLSLIFIFASFLWRAGKNLVSLFQEERFNKEDYGASPSRSLFDLAIFSSFLALIFSLFIYPANFTLLFYLWFLLGILSQRNQRMKDPVFFRAPLTPIIPSVLIFLSVTILSFFLIRNYLAETKYLSGLKFWQQGKLESATDKINGAISLNPDLDNYYRDISQLYLDKLEGALGDNQLSQEEKASKSQVLFREAIRLAIRATEISKENVANWNNLGFIRQSLIDLTGESEDLAIDSYKRANELEPTNPLILTKIGELYLHKAEMLLRRQKEVEATESLKEAKNNFQKAISLKADYSPAHFQLAIALIRENRVEEAIKKLEETRLLSPFDTEVAFQLGLLYYSGNQLDLAKAELERAVRLDQNYSNARYFLGLIFDKEGNKEKAIEQFEWIEKLNPENPEVKTILENLRGGKPALEEISSNQ